MPTEKFIDYNFRGDSEKIVNMAIAICNNYRRQGYDLSLRQLYYQFISKDAFPNTEQSYKRLGDIISNARLAGRLDWDMIKDRGRETVSNFHWDSPADILDACASSFRIDTWADQPNYVEVMVEKQALEGVLQPVCRTLDIRFTANKGYSSSSALYETGKRLQSMHLGTGSYATYEEAVENLMWYWNSNYNLLDNFSMGENLEQENPYNRETHTYQYDQFESDRAKAKRVLSLLDPEAYNVLEDWQWEDDKLGDHDSDKFLVAIRPYLRAPEGGKTLHVVYLGDHDPSGIDMTRDVKERLQQFSRCPVHVHRIALNMDQIQQYNPPPNPAKLTDSRSDEYVRKFGSTSWELDALAPNVLASLVTNIVTGLRDPAIHEAAVAKQQAWRDELKTLAGNFR